MLEWNIIQTMLKIFRNTGIETGVCIFNPWKFKGAKKLKPSNSRGFQVSRGFLDEGFVLQISLKQMVVL